MCPSKVENGGHRGWIIPIGGAEEKEENPRILERFVRLAGGDKANVVIIPTASRLPDTGERYEAIFNDLGWRHQCRRRHPVRAHDRVWQ